MSEQSMVRVVSIIGAGTMGRRIAYGCVVRGVRSQLFDVSEAAVQEAMEAVGKLVEEVPVTPAADPDVAMSLLHACSDLEASVTGADWVIETVPENLELKRTVLADIGAAAPRGALITSNTSSIPGSWLADSTGRPGRFVNMNWGTPEHLKVEVMGHDATAPETIAAAERFLRQIGLVPIVARREIQGYPTNRIWRAIKKESLYLIAGGYLTPEDIDRAWMLDWHTDVGPCGLMDIVGLDVIRDIETVYYEASGDASDKPPQFLDEMVTRGERGVKSGKGFYDYPSPAYQAEGWLTEGSGEAFLPLREP